MVTEVFFSTCIIIALNFVVALSSSSPGDQGCVLNTTALSFQPTGECVANNQEKIRVWDSFPTTHCCQNALNALSRALADQARIAGNNLFLTPDQWNSCSGPFKQQPSVSIDTCGFQNLNSQNGKCSNLTLKEVEKIGDFNGAVNHCADFNSSSSFENGCRKCVDAVKSTKESLLAFQGVKEEDDNENAICLAAAIISFTAAINRTNVDDFYRCLPALNTLGPENYFKIKRSVFFTFIAIVLALMFSAALILLVKYVTKNTKVSETKEIHETAKELASCPGLYRFSKAEIENAISLSNEKKSLGRGSAGQVFKGILPSGQEVAIKQIFKNNNTTDSFSRELEGLSRIRHPNLVCLFGCCFEDGEQYLVYEYCSAGNLAQYLLRKDRILTWEQRVKILRDCALSLRYLHNYIDGCIVHRDIKLTNILLSDNLNPKLSDFGLAKVLGMEESKVFTDVRGTIGYMDPEYMSNAKLTSASDVYSFGIVSLQVLSGQKVIELDLDARDQLTRKAKDVSIGKRPLKDFEDPRLRGQVNSVDFESILQIAVLCVCRSSKGRPSIDVVFEEMEKVYKNVLSDKKAKELSATSALQSLDVIAV